MKKLLIILLVIITPLCKTSNKIQPEKVIIKKIEPFNVNNLKDFFIRSELDVRHAGKVIVERDIVKNLSHLLRMDAGGKKYYILERENITRMIESVTKGVYIDYILINRKGTIIYTRVNNDIFGKNVRSHLIGTPLFKCYSKIKEDVYFEDISILTPAIDRFSLFIAVKVKGGNSFPGIFILQVSSEKIKEVLEKNWSVLSNNGINRIVDDDEQMLTPYRNFNLISTPINDSTIRHFITPEKVKYRYKSFRFKNIFWIILLPGEMK